jgi:hydroxypyruvate reductase
MNSHILLDIFKAALAAVDPLHAVRKALRIEKNRLHAGGGEYSLDGFSRVLVVGAGKAAARMAMAIEELLGERISGGLIIVKDGHAGPLRTIRQAEASHPVPDERGVEGTRRVLHLVRSAGDETLVLCLLSGGGSALLVAPERGLTLADKRETTDLLLRAGASINELNAVRKHLSSVKGGRLAEAAAPATLLSLILSDVIGDRLDVIASGPTAPYSTTFGTALAVMARYGLEQKVPKQVREHLEQGAHGLIPETVKADDPCLSKTRNVVIGGNSQALAAAREKARQLGFEAEIMTAALQGEARDAAIRLARTAMETKSHLKPGERRCLLAGGETTVTVRNRERREPGTGACVRHQIAGGWHYAALRGNGRDRRPDRCRRRNGGRHDRPEGAGAGAGPQPLSGEQ